MKWPNDVLLDGRKVAGILVEARLQEGWAVLGIGVNVAVDVAALPAELRERRRRSGVRRTRSTPRSTSSWPRCTPGSPSRGERDREPARARRAGGPPAALDGRRGRRSGHRRRRPPARRAPDGTVQALEAGEVHLGTAAGSAHAMDPIIVRRHGGRWAVQDGPDGTPFAEYDSRELAETAARQDAGGREVVVHDDGEGGEAALGSGGGVPTGEEQPPGRDAGINQRTGPAGGTETPRSPQGGL